MKRIIHFRNTEEQYRFCPQEILYANIDKGTERMEVHLLNNCVYSIPSSVKTFMRTIDESLMNTPNVPFVQVGRSCAVNFGYIKEAKDGNVYLHVEVENHVISDKILISKSACQKLSSLIGQRKGRLASYQHDSHPEGYGTIIKGGGRYTGFLMQEYVPKQRDDDFYDIDDDDILFLGI